MLFWSGEAVDFGLHFDDFLDGLFGSGQGVFNVKGTLSVSGFFGQSHRLHLHVFTQGVVSRAVTCHTHRV